MAIQGRYASVRFSGISSFGPARRRLKKEHQSFVILPKEKRSRVLGHATARSGWIIYSIVIKDTFNQSKKKPIKGSVYSCFVPSRAKMRMSSSMLCFVV